MRIKIFAILIILTIAIVVPFNTVLNSTKASALSGSDWIPGNIIDDTIFTDKGRLSVAQIQDFLNSKVPNCDTNGTAQSELGGGTRAQYGASQGNPAPFTCLKDYYEVPKTSPSPGIPASNYGGVAIPVGAKSAAQIIWDAAQKYNISPAVLLVKLGTESAGPLTSDPWPFKKQYNYAMGARCPDSGAGGSANCDQNYAGFSIQMDEGAELLRWYLDSMSEPWWSYKKPYATNNILWNVVERGCGGSDVYIQNKATAALYTYTPYQPNQAALNNLYGTGDNCSAYGNRNFWRVYTDWFGSTNGSIIRTYEDGKMYVRGAGNTYYYIVNGEQLSALGYGSTIKTYYNTSKNIFNSMTFAGDLPFTVRFNSGEFIYALDGGQKHYYDYENWTAYGQPAAGNLAAEFDQLIPTGAAMSSVVKIQNGYDLYSVQNGKKRYIGGPNVYQSGGYNTKPILPLSSYMFNALPKGAPILEAGTLIRTTDTKVISVVNSNMSTKRTVDTAASKSISIYPFEDTSATLDQLTTTAETPVPLLVRNSQGDLFLTEGTRKIHLTSAQLTSLGKTANDFTQVDPSYLNRFTTSIVTGDLLVRIGGGEKVYKIEAGELMHIQTGDDFNKLGYSSSNVVSIFQNTADLLLTNRNRTLVFSGTLFRVENTPTVYLLGTDNKPQTISTGYVFNSFRLNNGSVRVVSQTTLDAFVLGTKLSYVIKTPDNAWWLISNGLRFWIPENLRTNYTSQQNLATNVPNSTLQTINPTRNATQFMRVDSNPIIYFITAGEKRALSQYTFANLGGTLDQVISVSPYTAENFKTGSTLY